MDWSELLNWPEYSKLLVGLLALTNPLGALPVFMSATQSETPEGRSGVARTSLVVFVITLITFTFVGAQVLGVFGITIPAFRIAGGFLFFFFALEMLGVLRIPDTYSDDAGQKRSIGIVPLGIPMLAGPGAISSVILYADFHDGLTHKLLISVVIVIVIVVTALIVYGIFRVAMRMGGLLTPSTMVIVNRVMGLLLAAIAIEFILDGIAGHFPDLVMIEH
jgi:multiple antibiotic resistance protein